MAGSGSSGSGLTDIISSVLKQAVSTALSKSSGWKSALAILLASLAGAILLAVLLWKFRKVARMRHEVEVAKVKAEMARRQADRDKLAKKIEKIERKVADRQAKLDALERQAAELKKKAGAIADLVPDL